jgi:UDP-N-acetyl-D-mannosaminuronic acid dehydrogenase
LVESAPDLATLIHAARRVNDSQPYFALDLVRKAIGPLRGRKIAALGLAFKEDVDDLRESPAVELAHLMAQEGAFVSAFEPNKPEAGFDGFKTVSTLAEALQDAEVIVFLVGHSEFRQLHPQELAEQTSCRQVVDMRGLLSRPDWEAAGFQLYTLGVARPVSG